MKRISQKIVMSWYSLGTRFLPFADAASPDLPLSRLLRLSLFQVSVGMALVLLVGTLNRVMIVEMKVPATLVSTMVALPLLFAPLRALIGFRSDNHRSELGWRRVPYIWMGTLMQFGGFSIMPFALLVLAGAGQSAEAPAWIGQLGAAVAFLLVGAGLHTTQTVGLALATDLAPTESQPKVVGLMYVMLLVGMIFSAIAFGDLLTDYSPGRLVQVIQGAALATMVLNVVALWKQEPRSRLRKPGQATEASFSEAWQAFSQGPQAMRRLLVVALGTMAFTMEDVLLEPYGGEILQLSVSATTKLTATLSVGSLLGFSWASYVLSRGMDPFKMAHLGVLVGLPAFMAVILSAPLESAWVFGLGTFLIGLGAGLFSHGTLTATMNHAPPEQTGLALGAWGAVQATAAGVAMSMGGVLRDLLTQGWGALTGYSGVYLLEIGLLVVTWVVMLPLLQAPKNPAFDAIRHRV
ncbi:MAG: PucC family protein [Burkholderiaceae bacterium]|nr:PucC family protein [Burkholderiaceae bacterium]